jgi:tetratricopeptide (TPR) repeat protein
MAEEIELAIGGSKSAYDSKPSRSSIFAPSPRPPWLRLLPAVIALALLVALALPQSRDFLRSISPFPSAERPVGVAVIPFTLTGDQSGAEAFGRGLSNMINDRLAGLEQYSGRFWVVPADEIKRREVEDETTARACLGVQQIISGSGTLRGNTITLNMTVYDTRNHSRITREFRDFDANLKTWQSGLLDWLTGVIDPELGALPERISGVHSTNIPASFIAFQYGLGHLVDASGGPGDVHASAALPYLERAVASDSSFSCAWTQLGRAVFLKYGISDSVRVSEAETYLATAARLDTTAVWPHYYLGNLKARLGDSNAALGEYRRALVRDPLHGQTLNSLGSLHHRNGDEKRAEAAYNQAIDARPFYPRAYREAGVFHYYREDKEKALKNIETMVELAPDDELGYRMLGVIYFAHEDYQKSETMMERSLAIKPTDGAYANLGVLYYYDHRYLDSIAMSRKALEMEPDDFGIWRTLLEAYRFAPGFEDSVRPASEKAMELLQVRLAQDPEDPDNKADHASFCQKLGKPETALEILADLEANYSELDPNIMFSMASTYEELGERDRALDWLEKAVGKEMSFKKVDHYPVLKNLQSHPRYIAMRKKHGG